MKTYYVWSWLFVSAFGSSSTWSGKAVAFTIRGSILSLPSQSSSNSNSNSSKRRSENQHLIVGRTKVCLQAKLRSKNSNSSSKKNKTKTKKGTFKSTKVQTAKKTTSKHKGDDGGSHYFDSSMNIDTDIPKANRNTKKTKSTPPWQVLNTKDAKKNIETEKKRRNLAQQGIHQHTSQSTLQQQQHEQTLRSLSTNFLSEPERRYLKWKRFNPNTRPASMRFVGSYLDLRLPERLGVPEIAFLGRSNVGKSSLLNRLSAVSTGSVLSESIPTTTSTTSQKKVKARVGKTPGATASVNLYALVDAKGKDLLGWADLPGFGYAKLSKETKESVQAAAENYLNRRQELVLGVLLVDIRRDPSEDDRNVLAALYDMNLPIVVVATKADKIKNKDEKERCLATIRKGLGLPDNDRQPLCISSATGEGTKSLWTIILDACETGVQEFAARYDKDAKLALLEDQERQHNSPQLDEDFLFGNEDGNKDEEEEIRYSQGYDWEEDE